MAEAFAAVDVAAVVAVRAEGNAATCVEATVAAVAAGVAVVAEASPTPKWSATHADNRATNVVNAPSTSRVWRRSRVMRRNTMPDGVTVLLTMFLLVLLQQYSQGHWIQSTPGRWEGCHKER